MHFVCCVVVIVNRVILGIKYQEVMFFLSVALPNMFLGVRRSCHMSVHTDVHKTGENSSSSRNTRVVLTYY
jgi:hypothetical protein